MLMNPPLTCSSHSSWTELKVSFYNTPHVFWFGLVCCYHGCGCCCWLLAFVVVFCCRPFLHIITSQSEIFGCTWLGVPQVPARPAAPCEAGRLREADARPEPAKAWKGENSVSAFRMVAEASGCGDREVMENPVFFGRKNTCSQKKLNVLGDPGVVGSVQVGKKQFSPTAFSFSARGNLIINDGNHFEFHPSRIPCHFKE